MPKRGGLLEIRIRRRSVEIVERVELLPRVVLGDAVGSLSDI